MTSETRREFREIMDEEARFADARGALYREFGPRVGMSIVFYRGLDTYGPLNESAKEARRHELAEVLATDLSGISEDKRAARLEAILKALD